MNKLFNFTQVKGKWHKFPSFDLGGGAKLYKNFAQKLLAVSLCMAVVLLGAPVTTFAHVPSAPQFEIDTSTGYIKSVTGAGSLPTITIPKQVGTTDVKGVDQGVFDGCASLATFAVEDGHPYLLVGSSGELLGRAGTAGNFNILYRLPPAFAGEYTLPATVTKINDGAFTNCSGLTIFNLGSINTPVSWSDFSFAGCSSLASFAGRRAGLRSSFSGAAFPLLGEIGGDYLACLAVAPAAVGHYAVESGYDSGWSFLQCALKLAPSASWLLLPSPELLMGTAPQFGGMFGVPVLVPVSVIDGSGGDDITISSDDPASVLGYEVDEDDSSKLYITSRTGNAGKQLNLACDTFKDDGYALAIKDGAEIPNLTITHAEFDEDHKCTACGAVDPSYVPVTGVSLSDTTKSLTVGESFELTATVEPETATDSALKWTVDDTDLVAFVDGNGQLVSTLSTAAGASPAVTVTGLKAGTATITATASDGSGVSDSCTVTVTDSRSGDLPPIDRSSWGTPYVRDADGVTQYVVEDPTSPDFGMTSVELIQPMASSTDYAGYLTFWLHETSGSTSAWYGLTVILNTVRPGYRFYVQWLSPGDPGYDALFATLDDAAKQRIEGDNGWIFNMGIRDPDGHDLHYITDPYGVSTQPIVYVQIGDDWDVDDLNAYYIAHGPDTNVPVDYLMLDYPEGTDIFGRLTLDHFSPYFIFDELTDAEKAALGNGDGKTGDLATQLLISGLSIVLVSSLGVMLRLITNKRKFED